MKNIGFELFEQERWSEAAESLEKLAETAPHDKRRLACLGICYLRRQENEKAISIFKTIAPPLPPIAALNWALYLIHKRRFDDAVQALSTIEMPRRTSSLAELLEFASCVHLTDILSSIRNPQIVKEELIKIKRRITRLTSFGIRPFIPAIGALADCASRFGIKTNQIRRFISGLIGQHWIHGLRNDPDFLNSRIDLANMKGYGQSLDVYVENLLAYLDYWMGYSGDWLNFIISSIKPRDAHALYCLICEKRPATILEIGTFTGFSASIMARAVESNGFGKIHCVDPNMGLFSTYSPLSHAQRLLSILHLDQYIEFHEGFFSPPRSGVEGNVPVLGIKARELFPPIDLAFIDGDHESAAVLQDFFLILPRLADKATIVFHDIHAWSTVKEAIYVLFRDSLWRRQMRYMEFKPSGFDGLGVIELDKTIKPADNKAIRFDTDNLDL